MGACVGSWRLTPLAGWSFLDKYTGINTRYLVLLVTAIPYSWQLILAFMILKREGDEVRWKTIKDRLWLRAPGDPRTGKQKKVLWF